MEIPPLFRLARAISKESTYKIQMGAVLVRKGKPIAVGKNKICTHPKYANPSKHVKLSIHAEIACLINSNTELKGDTIYVYRENRAGIPALSRPCPECQEALIKYGVKRILYSIPHPPYYAEEYL